MSKIIDPERLQQAIAGGFLACEYCHSGSCLSQFTRFCSQTAVTMSKAYLPIHIIPFLLFKRKKLLKQPAQATLKTLQGYIKSILFACSYTGLLGLFMCQVKNYLLKDHNGTLIIPISAFLSGVALLFENETRRQQIALYLIPKVTECFYLLMRRRGLIVKLKGIEILVFGLAMAILSYFYIHGQDAIKPSYLNSMKKVLGVV